MHHLRDMCPCKVSNSTANKNIKNTKLVSHNSEKTKPIIYENEATMVVLL